jgi:hypothetical protein
MIHMPPKAMSGTIVDAAVGGQLDVLGHLTRGQPQQARDPFGGDVHPGRMAACSRLHLPVISPSVTVRDTSTTKLATRRSLIRKLIQNSFY